MRMADAMVYGFAFAIAIASNAMMMKFLEIPTKIISCSHSTLDVTAPTKMMEEIF